MRCTSQGPAGPGARHGGPSGGQLAVRSALVFAAAERLPSHNTDFHALGAGEAQAREAAAGTRDEARPDGACGFAVPSDAALGLRPGSARVCVTAVIAIARGQQLVGAARGGQGPANPDEANAPGGGIVEMIGTARELVRQALRVVEVLAPSDEDRGFQQGWPTPAAARRRRSLVAAHLRAKFIAL